MESVTLFSGVLAEFRTRKAAEKYAARVIGQTAIRTSEKSAFDPLHPRGKTLYQVIDRRPSWND